MATQSKVGKGKNAEHLQQLLSQCRVPPGDSTTEQTHTGWDNANSSYNGKFHVPLCRSRELAKLLAKAVYADGEAITLVERPGKVGPVRIDLDIKYTVDPDNAPPTGHRVYSGAFMDTFIGMVSSMLHEYLVMPTEPEKLVLYVFEKSAPTQMDNGIYKDGVHIMLPHILTTPAVQKFMRAKIIQDEEFEGLMTDMRQAGYNLVEGAGDIYDEAVIERNGWMLYGCRKPGKPGYVLTGIWNAQSGDDLHKYSESEYDDAPVNVRKQLSMLFLNRHCKYTGSDSYAEQFIASLSIRGYDCVNELPTTELYEGLRQQELEMERKSDEKKRQEDPHWRKLGDDDKKFALALVTRCLSKTRAVSRESWSKLGWCLYNIHNADDELKNAYIAFSKTSPQHIDEAEAACEKLWATARSEHDGRAKIGMGSLCDWAKLDNPEEYKRIMSGRLEALILHCCNRYMPESPPVVDADGNVQKPKLKASSWDDVNWYLVEVLYKQYGYNMVCTSMANRTWWEYKNHRWTDITEGLRNYLSVDVFNLFDGFARTQSAKLAETDVAKTEERYKYERLSAAAAGIARNTRNITSKSKIFNESSERFAWSYRSHTKDRKHDKSFEELLDVNLYLVGLENGVYDLKAHAFRPGSSDDMISRCTGNVWWAPKDRWNDPVVKDIQNFLRQVLPDPETRRYVLTLFASFLDGKVTELFHLFVGCGGNGKSKLIDLFTFAMGQSSSGGGYCGNLPTSALTGKRACSSGPSPEFERLRGMRFVVVQEPEPKDRIQPGRLKELTGGDTIQARALHKAPIEFKPQFDIVMASNVLPKVPGDDGGLWRRMRVVRFKSRFRREPIEDDPLEFHIDENLPDKLYEWRLAFFWMLTEYYKVYVHGDDGIEPILQYDAGESRAKKGLPKAPAVEFETSRYQTQNDPINRFILDNLQSDLSPQLQKDACVHFDNLWVRYKGWCTMQQMPSDQDDLRNAMEHRFDVMEDTVTFRGWRKIRMLTETEVMERAEGQGGNGGHTQ